MWIWMRRGGLVEALQMQGFAIFEEGCEVRASASVHLLSWSASVIALLVWSGISGSCPVWSDRLLGLRSAELRSGAREQRLDRSGPRSSKLVPFGFAANRLIGAWWGCSLLQTCLCTK